VVNFSQLISYQSITSDILFRLCHLLAESEISRFASDENKIVENGESAKQSVRQIINLGDFLYITNHENKNP